MNCDVALSQRLCPVHVDQLTADAGMAPPSLPHSRYPSRYPSLPQPIPSQVECLGTALGPGGVTGGGGGGLAHVAGLVERPHSTGGGCYSETNKCGGREVFGAARHLTVVYICGLAKVGEPLEAVTWDTITPLSLSISFQKLYTFLRLLHPSKTLPAP